MDVRRKGWTACVILFMALFLCFAGSLRVRAMNLDKTAITLIRGSSDTIYLEGAKGPVMWKSSNRKVATVSGGVVCAVRGGTTNVRAVCCGRNYYCRVKVVGLNRKKITMAAGQTYQLKLYNAKAGVWESSDPFVAEVSPEGEVTAKAPGTAKITCNNGSQTFTCKICVAELNAYSLSMEEGETFALTCSQTTAKAVWTSDNTTVAEVSSKGIVTAISGGKAVISCKCGDAVLTCQVTVAGDNNVLSKYQLPTSRSHREKVTVKGQYRDISYYIYNQGSSKNKIRVSYLKSYMACHGCAATTAATVLGGMLGKEVRPKTMITKIERKVFGKKSWKRNYKRAGRSQMPVCLNGIQKVYKAYHVNTTYVRSFTDRQAKEQIYRHLKKGNPIIFVVSKRNRKTGKKDGRWTAGFHTMAMIGLTQDGKVVVADSVNRRTFGSAQRLKLTTLDAILPYMFPATKIKDNNYWGSSRSSGGYLLVYSKR